MLIHMVADYGYGDLAFVEVVQRMKLYLLDAEPVLTPVPPFSTLAVGFCVAQLGLNQAPPGTIVYHNVAPRADEEAARAENTGERLAFALLSTGVRVVGVNAGYAFSFVRDAAEELRWASDGAGGSQFRSRDLFPRTAADVVFGRPGALAGTLETSAVPDVPRDRVAYVDGYGNLKTTIEVGTDSGGGAPSGSAVWVRIRGVEREATASDGSFEVEEGRLACASGSSGWKRANGVETRFVELFLRGGSAWEEFGHPPVGSEVRVVAA